MYFDHSATTPLDPRVLKEMLPYLEEYFGNPSSIHSYGLKAVQGVDKAREQVASFLNCEPEEIFFTSGATESDNLAIQGIIKAARHVGVQKPHIITTTIEHKAVLEVCQGLESEGVEVTYLPVDKKGLIKLSDLEEKIKDETVLVSIMYVNSEIGTLEPVMKAGKLISRINEKRMKKWQNEEAKFKKPKPRLVCFHTDATQAVNFFSCAVDRLHADLLSLSSHKIYGPKGVGLLYVKKGIQIESIIQGGGQEMNLRSGTLNVPGIVGLGKALSLITPEAQEKNNKKIAILRDILVDGILKNIPDVILNTPRETATPSHAHFSFNGIEGESTLISLDLEGIAVSTGSACASANLKSSHVLKAIGVGEEMSHYAVRFTLGRNNTEAEIKKILKVLPEIIKKFRNINPIYKK